MSEIDSLKRQLRRIEDKVENIVPAPTTKRYLTCSEFMAAFKKTRNQWNYLVKEKSEIFKTTGTRWLIDQKQYASIFN